VSALILPADIRFEEIAEPYDPDLDAGAALDAAFVRARKRGTHVIAIFGARWCPDCRVLAGMMAIPALAALLADRFETVAMDVGRYDKNMDLTKRFGLGGTLEGVPALIIADARGQVLNPARIYDWRTARERSPQALADALAPFAQ
jgi:thiol-disulfide isomerase/thioredoxin